MENRCFKSFTDVSASPPRLLALEYLSLMWLQSFISTFDQLSEPDHCSLASVLNCSQKLDSLPVTAVEGPAARGTPVSHDVIGSANTDVEVGIIGMSKSVLIPLTCSYDFLFLLAFHLPSNVFILCHIYFTIGLVANLCIKDSLKHVFNKSISGCGHPSKLEKLLGEKNNNNKQPPQKLIIVYQMSPPRGYK